MSMTLAHLLPEHSLPPDVAGLAIRDMQLDSRRLQAGDLFMAVGGERADGRRFIEDAIAAGAVAVLAESDRQGLERQGDVPVISVPDLRRQAGNLAGRLFGEPGQSLQVVAVTGTNGKTSTSWFLRDALQALGRDCALLGTLGALHREQSLDTGHTTPDVISLHRLLARFRDGGADSVVMEASSHALAQNRLDGVPVAAAVFTNLSHEHLDYHGDMDAYYRAKARLFQRPELGLAVVNEDDAAGRRLLSELPGSLPRLTFGGADSDVRCDEFLPDEQGMKLVLRLGDEQVAVHLPLFGRFNVENLLAVAATLKGLGHAAGDIGAALARVTPVPGRMEPVPAEQGPRVLVDYAHTPDALEKALAAAREHFHGRLVCVVGAGGERDTAKRPQMAATAERLADRVVLTADNPRGESVHAILEAMLAGVTDAGRVRVEPDRARAVQRAVLEADDTDLVLVAGKGHETEQEIDGQRIPMDDRELAGAALAARGGEA